jgi:predicted phosphoadenosine phosphosulfate sulfurtransferase
MFLLSKISILKTLKKILVSSASNGTFSTTQTWEKKHEEVYTAVLRGVRSLEGHDRYDVIIHDTKEERVVDHLFPFPENNYTFITIRI